MNIKVFIKKYNIIIKNTFYLFVIQGLNYILPLITIPYLTRVLGMDKYGAAALLITVITYFQLVTDYGFNLSATRKISINKENKEEVSIIFWSVILIKSLIAIGLFIIFIVLVRYINVFNENSIAYYIGFLMVIGNILLPIWLFQGMEEMEKIALFNTSIKILITVSTFIFIKSEKDFILYILIYSVSNLFIGIVGFIYAIKIYRIELINFLKIKLLDEVKDGWYIFSTNIMANLLSNSGTLVLGILGDTVLVGYYSVIDKVAKACAYVFSPIMQALYPYISKKLSKSNKVNKNSKKEIFNFAKYIVLLAIILSIFLTSLSKYIVIILTGENLISLVNCLRILSIWIIFTVINNFIGIQYLIGSGNGRYYSKSFTIAVIITLTIYLLTINKLTIYAIPIGTFIGEISLMICMIYSIRKYNL